MLPIHNVLMARGIRPLAAWLTRGGPGWLRIGAVFFLLVCIIIVILSWGDLRYAHSGSLSALTESFEETKGAHKGLEAFVLSGLGEKLRSTVVETNVAKEFLTNFNLLHDAVNSSQPRPSTEPREPPGLTVETRNTLRPTIADKYVTNTDGQGFLFIPGMVIGASLRADATDADILAEAEKERGVLRSVIVDSKRAAPILKTLLDVKVVGVNDRGLEQEVIATKPVQAYFLTATGLIRLVRGGVSDVHAHYAPQFKPTNFFPERPYFWKTVDNSAVMGKLEEDSPYKIDKVFNTTNPYIDYGGNGIVVTLSRPLEGAAVKSGLFLDFALGDYAEKSIKQKVEKLGGSWAKISWAAKDPEPELKAEEGRLSEQAGKALAQQIKNYYKQKNLSEISGKLFVILREGGKVAFTVPVGETKFGGTSLPSEPSSGKLLYCELDLDSFQRWVLYKAVAIAVSFTAFVGFIGALVVDYGKRLQEQEKAFESFGQVMAKAPVAYCRVNEHNEFIDMNKAFATLLGYESLEEAREDLTERQTFESLLADDRSRRKYEEIREMRRDRKRTDPYHVRFRGKNRIVDVRVYGASVSMPKSHPKADPQTFGIVLEEDVKVTPSDEMSVRPVFGLPKKPAKPADMFVLMKFAPQFDAVYRSIEGVARHLNLRVARADQILSTKAVMSEVWASINAAQLIIADCTGLNPNVFYEIGVAHALGKPVVLITQDEGKMPFNIAHLRFISYSMDTTEAVKEFERTLKEIVESELGLGAQ